METFPIDDWRELLRPGRNVLAIEGHNVTLDSSDFTLDPSLVLVEEEQSVSQVVDAWDAETGEPLWQAAITSSGKRLNGPAGCAGDGWMYFTGGGESPDATGETIAIVPRTGEVVWQNPAAFASQTGTPSFRDGRLYLPGSYKQPLACLDVRDGSIVWQQEEGRNHWFVETVSLAPDYFTVNNKYTGGALRWNLATGTMTGTPDERIQLWGPAHGCGAVVLTSEGMALSATIDGLFMTDTSTGEVVWKSPGFASYTCPHAIPANGRIFYCPQTSGVMFCFEPVAAE
jgi:outer membrane protein assembly factor BamB